MPKSATYFDLLRTLKLGAELNVHTKDKTYYDAVFCKLNLQKGMVIVRLDSFYDSGGYLVEIPVNEIRSMDLPLSSFQAVSKRE